MRNDIASPTAQPIHWIRTLILVEEAADGPHALTQLKSACEAGRPFDIVLLDHMMPVMAGVSLDKMKSYIGDNVPIIRTMPNTPLLVKKGSTAFAGNEHVTETHCNLVQEMFTSIGKCVQVKENMLDAVTGVSGSGPAFVTMFIEAMADGGVYAGLPRNIALELATNTVLGTATLIAEKGMHPAVAKDMVTSPGGTTIYGLRELEDGKFRATIINAVNAAAQQASALNSKK